MNIAGCLDLDALISVCHVIGRPVVVVLGFLNTERFRHKELRYRFRHTVQLAVCVLPEILNGEKVLATELEHLIGRIGLVCCQFLFLLGYCYFQLFCIRTHLSLLFERTSTVFFLGSSVSRVLLIYFSRLCL